MDQVKTWTVEEIEQQAKTRCDHAFVTTPEYLPIECADCGQHRDVHVQAAMLRAFAAQTRQVELMRQYLKAEKVRWEERRKSGKGNVEFVAGVATQAHCDAQEFAALFPKDGAQ